MLIWLQFCGHLLCPVGNRLALTIQNDRAMRADCPLTKGELYPRQGLNAAGCHRDQVCGGQQPLHQLLLLGGHDPKHLALIHSATSLFRGAGYTPFDGSVPEQPGHAAVANPYAHVTAPLRRLVDRFGLVVCEALSSGAEVPEWVRTALPALPEIMSASDRIANGVSRACTDAVEAAEMTAFVGQRLAAVVVEENEKGVLVQLTELGVVAKASGQAQAGAAVTVSVDSAEIATGRIALSIVA